MKLSSLLFSTSSRSVLRCAALCTTLAALGCGGDEPEANHAAHAGHGDPQAAAAGQEGQAGHEGHEGHEGHAGHEGHEPLPTLPGADARASLFDLDAVFHDSDGNEVRLADLRGGTTLVAMFYSTCTSICPLILTDLANVLEQAGNPALKVVVVTFDPERDTAERLTALRTERGFDAARWKLLRGDDEATRDLAMALGVQYRRTADGEFSHSALIVLLDSEGHIVARHEGVAQPLADLVAAARTTVPGAAAAAPAPAAAAPAPAVAAPAAQ